MALLTHSCVRTIVVYYHHGKHFWNVMARVMSCKCSHTDMIALEVLRIKTITHKFVRTSCHRGNHFWNVMAWVMSWLLFAYVCAFTPPISENLLASIFALEMIWHNNFRPICTKILRKNMKLKEPSDQSPRTCPHVQALWRWLSVYVWWPRQGFAGAATYAAAAEPTAGDTLFYERLSWCRTMRDLLHAIFELTMKYWKSRWALNCCPTHAWLLISIRTELCDCYASWYQWVVCYR